MRLRSLLREAFVDVGRGTARAGIFGMALAILLTALAVADVTTIQAIERSGSAYQQAGGSTLVFTAEGQIDGRRCDAIREVAGVRAAGAMKQVGKLVASALPDSSIPAFAVSPRFGGFTALGGVSPRDGSLASDQVAERLALRDGARLPTTVGSLTIGAVYSYADDGRQPGMGYAILLPDATTTRFDQCWAEVWPQSAVTERLLATTLVGPQATGARPPELRQLNTANGARFDGPALFAGRITRWVGPAAVLAAAALGYISIRRRRLELASALHCGVRPRDQHVQLLVETTLWAVPAALLAATGVTILVALLPTGDPSALTGTAVNAIAAGGAAVVPGAMLAALRTRERHLFDYFKQR